MHAYYMVGFLLTGMAWNNSIIVIERPELMYLGLKSGVCLINGMNMIISRLAEQVMVYANYGVGSTRISESISCHHRLE
jgi:hypothetical protein